MGRLVSREVADEPRVGASDGCFPFITNEDITPANLLGIYKAQPHLERRHAKFKGVIEAAPLTLKSCSHAHRSLDRLVEVVEVPPSPQAASSRPSAANTTPAASHRCRHRHHLVEPRASASAVSPRALRGAMSSSEALRAAL